MGIKWVDVCKAHDNNSQNKAISIAITYIIKATVIQASRYAQQNLILNEYWC